MLVTWQDFENTCKNLTVDFENMCRLFFKYHFVKNSTANIYQKANNPGIETEPVLIDGKRVGFQAKYFNKQPSYKDILNSAKNIVKYYAGLVDKVIIFCNQDLDIRSENYVKTVELLSQNNIEIELFYNNSILDTLSVHQEYSAIRALFFNKLTLSDEWFQTKLYNALKDLEPRYRPDLHVDEYDTQKHFDILFRNDSVFVYLQEIIDNAKKELKYINKEQSLVKKVLDIIDKLQIPQRAELEKVLCWYDSFLPVIKNIKQKRSALDDRLEDSYKGVINLDNKERDEIYSRLKPFNQLTNVIERFNLYEDEHFRFINNNILIAEGNAGKGKSHLLGFEAERHGICDKYRSVLLLGQKFVFDQTPQEQIVKILSLTGTFNDFLLACEARGELDGGITVIMIDAINECKKHDIWKQYFNELIEEIKKYKFIRLVCSIRTTYRNHIFTEKLLNEIDEGNISLIEVPGFKNNLTEAIPIFFNHYHIPISTAAFFNLEFENPLFLQTYCEAYSNGIGIGSRGIFDLYNAYIKKEERKVKEIHSIIDEVPYAQKIIRIIGEYMYENDTIYITLDELYKRSQHIINCDKFIDAFLNAKVLIQYNYDNNEYIYINYERFTDYIVAKHILDNTNSYDELCEWIKTELFKTNKYGYFVKHYIEGRFAALALLAREKYNKEIIDCINVLPEVDDANQYLYSKFVTEYLDSFMYRADRDIDVNDYYYIVENYVKSKGTEEKHLDILVGLSCRDCSLNINSTTKLLMSMSLKKRDYLWTLYINDKYQQGERVNYIIKYFLTAELKNITHNDRVIFGQILTWFLSSSNRILRDKSSRALIRLLKGDISAMSELLSIFNEVNDPYIISRLYGCVYGAILQTQDKSLNNEYLVKLATLIYQNIFNKKMVYPDILLRDYALNIIEFCKYKDIKLGFDIESCRPPYRSFKIPNIDISQLEKLYPESTFENWLGTNAIKFSMAPEHGIDGFTGGYGDFGRYTFESALREFKDVNIKNVFCYAYYFIVNNLGYDNKLFSQYDRRIGYGRGRDNCYIERIGKKYEWIAMYHILALASDMYKFNDEFYTTHIEYKGTWRPNVRDFEPTLTILNNNRNQDIGTILIREQYANWQLQNNDWTKVDDMGSFIENIRMVDSNGDVWYALNFRISDDMGKDSDKVRQSIWATTTACLIKKPELNNFVNKMQNRSFWNGGLRAKDVYEKYNIFAREYVWSPAYNDEYELNGFEDVEICVEGQTIMETVGHIMPCYHSYLWEEQFDYSKEDHISFSIPNAMIMNKLKLKSSYDGIWENDSEVVCADFKLIKNSNVNGLYIKEKYLRVLLEDLAIVWIGLGEKDHTYGTSWHVKQSWSEISSLVYENEEGNLVEKLFIEHKGSNKEK